MKVFLPKTGYARLAVLVIMSFLMVACQGAKPGTYAVVASEASANTATTSYTLITGAAEGKLVFIGRGGTINGVINPSLTANPGGDIQITLINGDGPEHDIAIPELGVDSESVIGKDSRTTVTFTASKEGQFAYYCTISGHRQAGMEGLLVIGAKEDTTSSVETVSVARSATDLPAPIGERSATQLRYDIQTVELEGRLADGTTFTYWTFDAKVPGPFLRVRVGDTVEVHLTNPASSKMTHSIDLHAATGPGGGAAVTQVAPGEEKYFIFKALNPGLYVYHCATPMVANHIANGMYGLILVEPEGGLSPVEHEFYVMQGEIYTAGAFGEQGHQEGSIEKLLDETPEYFIFNGAVGALTQEFPLKATVGDNVRIFFGVGGPNFIASFHVIGEIFDRVYDQASLTAPPLTDVQTTLVPPGGASVVEFTLEVPGRYILVDHALSRLERGLVGFLLVDGSQNPDIFYAPETSSSAH